MKISNQKYLMWTLKGIWEEDVGCLETDDMGYTPFEEWLKDNNLLEDE